jgi:hypothetical protein
VDGEAILHLGGEVVARIDEKREREDPHVMDGAEERFEVRARGGPVRVEGIVIDRDLSYQSGLGGLEAPGEEGLFVPEGHYFMLGDNSPSSSDSRKWKRKRIELRGGRSFWYGTTGSSDQGPVRDDDGSMVVTDVDGLERRWRPEDEDGMPRHAQEHFPFVSRDLIVGRAFFIFWPVLPDFPGRLGFIH